MKAFEADVVCQVQRGGSKRNQEAAQTASPPEAADDIVRQVLPDLPQSFEEGSALAAQKHDTEKASETEGSGIKMLGQEFVEQSDIKTTTSSDELRPRTPARENLSPRHSDISTFGSQTDTSSDGDGTCSDDDRSSIHESQVRDTTTPVEDSAEQAFKFGATSKDPSPVAPSSPAALPQTSLAAVHPASPPDSITSDNEVLDKDLSTVEPQQDGLSSDATQSLVHMAPTLSTTDTKDQQLLADTDAYIEFAALPLASPKGSSSASQDQNGRLQAADIAEEWPSGLTGWALLLCGRLQAKAPAVVRPFVDVAVSAAVEVLAATAALSDICF
ncbi:g11754 [Coccomyxa elongata]